MVTTYLFSSDDAKANRRFAPVQRTIDPAAQIIQHICRVGRANLIFRGGSALADRVCIYPPHEFKGRGLRRPTKDFRELDPPYVNNPELG